MSRLFLQCGLCGRKQADGLLSRNSWGHLDHHDPPLRACPACRSAYADWANRLVVVHSERVAAVYGFQSGSPGTSATG